MKELDETRLRGYSLNRGRTSPGQGWHWGAYVRTGKALGRCNMPGMRRRSGCGEIIMSYAEDVMNTALEISQAHGPFCRGPAVESVEG